jgi:hypothetical protein
MLFISGLLLSQLLDEKVTKFGDIVSVKGNLRLALRASIFGDGLELESDPPSRSLGATNADDPDGLDIVNVS